VSGFFLKLATRPEVATFFFHSRVWFGFHLVFPPAKE